MVGLTWKRDFLSLPRIPRRKRRRRWKEIILPYISYSKFGGEMSWRDDSMRFYYPQRNGSTKKRMERVRFSISPPPFKRRRRRRTGRIEEDSPEEGAAAAHRMLLLLLHGPHVTFFVQTVRRAIQNQQQEMFFFKPKKREHRKNWSRSNDIFFHAPWIFFF